VETAAVARRPLAITVEEEGRTRVRDRYVLHAPVAGYLRRIELDVGDAAPLGATLATLDPLRPATLDQRSRAEAEARVAAAAQDDDLTSSIALFAEARFGFDQMKAAGGDGEAARRGIERAAEAAVTLALRAGSPDTAQVFVTTTEAAPPELVLRVADARDKAHARTAKWRAAADDADLQIGKKARLRLVILLGIIASILSVGLHLSIASGRSPSHVVGVSWLIGIAVIGGAGYVALRKRLRNQVTRRFLLTLLVGIFTVIFSRLFFWRLGLSAETTDLMAMHVWWGVITAVTMAIERRLLPSVIFFGIGLLVVLRWPEVRNLVGAVEYAFFFANAHWAWRTRPADDPETAPPPSRQ
jgi:hypothetical protein